MIHSFFNGLCMAVADSVPGVSGGTIAFVLGFYEPFLEALHNLFGRDSAKRKKALCYLARLGAGWGLGMVLCVLILSELFAKEIYFMNSLFLGLTAASIPFILYAEKNTLKSSVRDLPFIIIGAGLVVALSVMRGGAGMLGGISLDRLQPLEYLYVLMVGAVAISAMVLPGISGSTILLIAGLYLPVVHGVKNLLHLNFAALPGLITLCAGVLLGVGLTIRLIRIALRRYRGQMLCLILGLMVGSLYAIVIAPTTLPAPLPRMSILTFRPLAFVLGIAILLGLEAVRKWTARKSPCGQPG